VRPFYVNNVEFEKYDVVTIWNGIKYVSNFVKICQLVQKLKGDTYTHTETG